MSNTVNADAANAAVDAGMERYPKLPYPQDAHGLLSGGILYVQEKLDGANFRATWNADDGWTFGSRRTAGEALKKDQFQPAIDCLTSQTNTRALALFQEDMNQQVVLFGEAMIPHTIQYDWDHTPGFIAYDIWLPDDQRFMLPAASRTICETYLGLEFAPIVDKIQTSDMDGLDIEVPESAYYDGLAEGVVLKNFTQGAYAKIVRDDFKEKNKEVFGASSKQELSDTYVFVEEYVPPARVRSVAHSLVDNGEYDTLQMPMMEDLPLAVIEDMATEEAVTIFTNERVELDLSEYRQAVASRCASVLQRMISEAQVNVRTPSVADGLQRTSTSNTNPNSHADDDAGDDDDDSDPPTDTNDDEPNDIDQ